MSNQTFTGPHISFVSSPKVSTWRGKAAPPSFKPQFGTRAFRTPAKHDTAQHEMRKAHGITTKTRPPKKLSVTAKLPVAPGQQMFGTSFGEAHLEEHPGHEPQSVHGHRAMTRAQFEDKEHWERVPSGRKGAWRPVDPKTDPLHRNFVWDSSKPEMKDKRVVDHGAGRSVVRARGYVYHGTSAPSLKGIAEKGVIPGHHLGGRAGTPWEREAKKDSWWSTDLDDAIAYGRHVVRTRIRGKGFRSGAISGMPTDRTLSKPVPAEDIDILTDTGEWVPLLGALTEAVLQEHPGHADQKSHGNRGVHAEYHDDLSGQLEPGSLKYISEDGGQHPSWEGRLRNGTRVFVKTPYLNELRSELAAESLNTFGAEGGLVRMPHVEVASLVLPTQRSRDRGEQAQTALVGEWVTGKGYFHRRDSAIEGEVDDLNVFDFVTANQDRHQGNAMVTITGHVWSIDHGQAFGDSPVNTGLTRPVSVPLTDKHRAWLTKVASTPPAEITAVLNSGLKSYDGAQPFHAGYGRQIVDRAQSVLDLGMVPGARAIGNFEQSGHLWEAVLQEHPGHPDQSVHGHRGVHAGLAAMAPAKWEDVGRATIGGEVTGASDTIGVFEMDGYTGEGQGPAIEAKIGAAEGLASELLADDARLKAMCSDPPPKEHLDLSNYEGDHYFSQSPVEDFIMSGSNFGAQHAFPGDVAPARMDQRADADALLRQRRYESIRLEDLGSQWGKMTPDQREQLIRTDESFRYALCSGYIKQWQITAADHMSVPLAIQHAAAKEFGLAPPPSIEVIGSTRRADTMSRAAATFEDHGQFLTGMVKATYARTQYELAFRGVTHVTIARGINSEEFRSTVYRTQPVGGLRDRVSARTGSTHQDPSWGTPGTITGTKGVKVTGHPLQSWSLDGGTALNFGMQVMVAKVSAKRIFAWPRTGQGCLAEAELVMLGGENDEVWGGDWEESEGHE